MKRTTVVLPDDLASLLNLESQRRHVSVAEVIRRALDTYLRGDVVVRKPVPFAALGRSGQTDTARNAEEILAREWTDAGRG